MRPLTLTDADHGGLIDYDKPALIGIAPDPLSEADMKAIALAKARWVQREYAVRLEAEQAPAFERRVNRGGR